jgi:hypothetical protein
VDDRSRAGRVHRSLSDCHRKHWRVGRLLARAGKRGWPKHCRELSDGHVNRAAAGKAAWRIRSHDGCLTCPCVAPHTAKIHTLITLDVSVLPKPLVFKARKRVPRGFDSHRPLHPQASSGNVGTRRHVSRTARAQQHIQVSWRCADFLRTSPRYR